MPKNRRPLYSRHRRWYIAYTVTETAGRFRTRLGESSVYALSELCGQAEGPHGEMDDETL
jgi:hypothetical protein